MVRSHFVNDYKKFMRKLMAHYPLDEVMSIAVGCSLEVIGEMRVEALMNAGLKSRMSVLDVRCGGGRTTRPPSKKYEINYRGTDVVQELLDYGASNCPHQSIFEERVPINSLPKLFSGHCFLPLGSVREHQAGLQSFRSMRRIEARRITQKFRQLQ